MHVVELKDGRKAVYLDASELSMMDFKPDLAHCSVQGDTAYEYSADLYDKGFLFSGRSVTLEVPLFRWKNAFKAGSRYKFSFDEVFDPGRVYDIACHHFAKDHRFALDPSKGEDEVLKNELLRSYIDHYRDKGCYAVFCSYNGQDVGFDLWRADDNEARIVLGGVNPEFVNSGISLYLYGQTLEDMQRRGVKIMKEKIAISNMASFNLHTMVFNKGGTGFKLVDYTDHYLWDRTKCH